uniref:Purple acid phosphatase Fn3-like domain-containing protein n=1 Tax=Solanum lycopersicum TaxID=4081 RepID=A0A3Q7HUY1_SOLLC
MKKFVVCFLVLLGVASGHSGEQPLSNIAIHKATVALDASLTIKAYPFILAPKGGDTEWVTLHLDNPNPSHDDWVGVFSPAKFNGSTCYLENDGKQQPPYICTAPIKAGDYNSTIIRKGVCNF